MAAIRAADPTVTCRIAAIEEPTVLRPYPASVRWRIRQGDAEAYRAAARAINSSDADIVNVQHEFGLYGRWTEPRFTTSGVVDGAYEDHLRPFLEELRKPVVTTMHTVLPDPSPSIREAVRGIAALSDEVIVMASRAVRLLAADYGILTPPRVVPHGIPVIERQGRQRFKEKLGVAGRPLISTFGLVDPRKGLQYMIEAMTEVVAGHPNALYLIAGQTHPELLRAQGETYRNALVAQTRSLGLDDHVAFIDSYMTQREVVELLIATDVYVTPYLDPNQITSGTLSYALGAGKAVVSTRYLHAAEALSQGRGVLVDFRAPAQLAKAVAGVLDNPTAKKTLEEAAFAYAQEAVWPRSAEAFLDICAGVTRRSSAGGGTRPRPTPAPELAHRLPQNPILTPDDVPPSLPGLEVVSVFNAAAARVGDEVVLLLRVGERPQGGAVPPPGALTLDLAAPEPELKPLAPGYAADQVVAISFLDTEHSPHRIVPVYLPRGTPGLDLSDPRVIRYRNLTGGFTAAADDVSDFLTQMSHLRVARSQDGVHFQVEEQPAILPATRLEEYGCEDPRATLIDGVWNVTYVSVGRLGMSTSRLTTSDFHSFDRHGLMFLPDHKDVALFPGRFDGRFAALTRPMPQSFGRVLGIWIAFSEDLVHWGQHVPLALPRPGMWDELRTGASAAPFRVGGGWLEIYHGVDRQMRYSLGALLLDSDDPSHVIARSPDPILIPTQPYERSGVFNDVVFACGLVPLDSQGVRIRVYYGAADRCLAAADFEVQAILDQMVRC